MGLDGSLKENMVERLAIILFSWDFNEFFLLRL